MTVISSYTGPLHTGSQSGPCIKIAARPSLIPQFQGAGPGSLPVAVAEDLQGGVTGTPYSETISGVGGVSPYSFSLSSGSLPTGLSLSSGGILSGTPSAAGTFTFVVKITDNNGSTSTTTFQITIASPSSGATPYAYAS